MRCKSFMFLLFFFSSLSGKRHHESIQKQTAALFYFILFFSFSFLFPVTSLVVFGSSPFSSRCMVHCNTTYALVAPFSNGEALISRYMPLSMLFLIFYAAQLLFRNYSDRVIAYRGRNSSKVAYIQKLWAIFQTHCLYCCLRVVCFGGFSCWFKRGKRPNSPKKKQKTKNKKQKGKHGKMEDDTQKSRQRWKGRVHGILLCSV